MFGWRLAYSDLELNFKMLSCENSVAGSRGNLRTATSLFFDRARRFLGLFFSGGFLK